jgi:tetratricopeptide (TPR) repeat protein
MIGEGSAPGYAHWKIMAVQRSRTSHFWMPGLLAAIAAIAIYAATVRQPFQAPDLELIAQSREAASQLTMGRAFFDALPLERPDLGVYRPVHGLLLKLLYTTSPANPRAFHGASVALYAIAVFLASAFAARIVARGSRFIWPVYFTALIIAIHPMATEAVNWAWAHHALLAAIGTFGSLLVYQLAREGRLRLGFAASIIGLGYFIAAGSFELGFLLPLLLLALHVLPVSAEERGKNKEEAPAPIRPARQFAIISIPLVIVFLALIGLRSIALDGALFPSANLVEWTGDGFGARLMKGIALAGTGLAKAFVPWRPTFFYSGRYEPTDALQIAMAIAALIAAAAGLYIAMKRNRPIALGLVLAGIPLIAALQIVPLSQIFSDRVLLLSIPGAAIVLGSCVNLIMSRARNAQTIAFLSAMIIIVPFGGMTFWRNSQWANSEKLWTSEAKAHPAHPGPLTYRLIDLVSRSRGQFDLDAIAKTAEDALKLAKSPDSDLIYHYLVLVRIGQGDPEKARQAIAGAMVSPPPHGRGYYSTLGIAAYRMGLLDQAEQAFTKELSEYPTHFTALYTLGEVLIARGDGQGAMLRARAATEAAPPHMESAAFALRGRAAAVAGEAQEAQLSLAKAVDLDPENVPAYLALARVMIDAQQYERADQLLARARTSVPSTTRTAIYALWVESLERQGRQVDVYDFLREMARRDPWDHQFLLWAARYYLEHRQIRPARELYARVSGTAGVLPAHASDALVGLGKAILLETGDARAAEQQWQLALAKFPGNQEARALLEELKRREGSGELSAQGASQP